MRVDPSKDFRIVYTLNPDSELGPIFEPYAVQLNNNGGLSLTYQKLYSNTMSAFEPQLDETDRKIIEITTDYTIENIARKFSKKEMRPHEFVAKFLDEKLLKTAVRPFVEDKLVECAPLLKGKPLFLRGKSGNPAHQELEQEDEDVSVYFHFSKEEAGTTYYPTFKCNGDSISFVNKHVLIVTNRPCILIADNKLYRFGDNIDGLKLTPFFSKWNIHIPPASEPTYYKKFIASLIEKHKVIAKGFDIIELSNDPVPVLVMEAGWNSQMQFTLYFDYQKDRIPASDPHPVIVRMENEKENYTYFKIIRNLESENKFLGEIESLGLYNVSGASYLPSDVPQNPTALSLVAWTNANRKKLESNGFQIVQPSGSSGYFLGEIKLNFNVKEGNDWFDVFAEVIFGDYKIPFVRLRKYILQEISEFTLPDGKIAVIPKEWFSKYRDLLVLSGSGLDENRMLVKKHHYSLVEEILPGGKDQPTINASFFKDFSKIGERNESVPAPFTGVLRPYQQEGYFWMSFLREHKFGGCLADDMGLGKTIQTLALLYNEEKKIESGEEIPVVENQTGQLPLFIPQEKQNGIPAQKVFPSLIIMPTSLIHNWQYEIKKWVPSLKTLNYTGLDRADKVKEFNKVDIILTTYGTARNDINVLRNYTFDYIILDESQVIKNPLAKVTKAVKMLTGRYKLALSGTPIENSLIDLWSQMSFLNPGLLGSYQYFRDSFVIPIEKKADEERKRKLKALINPFVLRRTKEEVAKDLPSLTEKVYFSEMTEEQRTLYEETRSFYRRKILQNMEEWGEKRAQFFVLKGLMQLRLIANHPRLNDKAYVGTSGKFDDIMANLENVLSEKHRVLIFSQFVRHLDLIGAHLKNINIPFTYLTGQTRLRAEEIRKFKENEENPVFLISLKAGGVGLNLTEADYVFMCDPWWNPAAEQQAINRAHRIGQDKSVFAYKFISKNTVEEKILLLQERKKRLSADFIQANQGFEKLLSKDDIEVLFS